MNDLELQTHAHKRIQQLSGGNKRRASICAAFLSDPDVVLLDEPSSGIDPAGRRKLSQLIQKERKNRAFVLTTHNMEEAETLCTRVGILINGELRCLNTCLAIKNKYGQGVILEIELLSSLLFQGKIRGAKRAALLSWLHANITPNIEQTEEVSYRLTYQVSLDGITLGKIFTQIEQHKEQLDIADYSVTQATLDQVFSHFAKKQVSRENE
uniref:ABC transporter A family member 11-like n=1 Tax=Dermatophagoides pteronyssinus TaxID=6956 RepID=A0A6P6YJI0_DERPT|nr:ABC transporter A family member 11-like [Dermatophagoides pteronyssinus]